MEVGEKENCDKKYVIYLITCDLNFPQPETKFTISANFNKIHNSFIFHSYCNPEKEKP